MGNSQAVESLKAEPAAPTVVKSDADWRSQLSPLAYTVTRQGGTERAFTGTYTDHTADGTYKCVCCGTDLFTSGEKFQSHCGWPAFYAPKGGLQQGGEAGTGSSSSSSSASTTTSSSPTPVRYLHDSSHGMERTEVRCRTCEAHLGHVFNDGPSDKGGLRYCINSVCLTFDPSKGGSKAGGDK